MKIVLLLLVLFLNTGCLSWGLSTEEDRYHDVMNEFKSFSESKPMTVKKAENFIYKKEKGTLFSVHDCLKGENRLLHVFMPESEDSQMASLFEDENLEVSYDSDVRGFINTVPFNLDKNEDNHETHPLILVEEGIRVLSQYDNLQINLSQHFMCHGHSAPSVDIIYEGRKMSGAMFIKYSERSRVTGAFLKLGYLVTVPVDVVCIAIGLPIAATVSIFN